MAVTYQRRPRGYQHTVLRERCNEWMPQAEEPCARTKGHTTEHRTEYAMSNHYRARGLVYRWSADE